MRDCLVQNLKKSYSLDCQPEPESRYAILKRFLVDYWPVFRFRLSRKYGPSFCCRVESFAEKFIKLHNSGFLGDGYHSLEKGEVPVSRRPNPCVTGLTEPSEDIFSILEDLCGGHLMSGHHKDNKRWVRGVITGRFTGKNSSGANNAK